VHEVVVPVAEAAAQLADAPLPVVGRGDDLMSGATALGGIFSARAISFGVRPAARRSRTRSSNCCVGVRNMVPEPAALLGRHAQVL
jgi:hypothetical protein